MYRKPTQGGDKQVADKDSSKNKASDRELINTGNDKRFVRRDKEGQFKESDDVGRSLTKDRKQAAKTTVPSGRGDRGDQKRN
jgi:hypothetical protein